MRGINGPVSQKQGSREQAEIASTTRAIHLTFAASCAKSLEGMTSLIARTENSEDRKQKAEAIAVCFASAASYMAQQYCQALYGDGSASDVPPPQGFTPVESNKPEAEPQCQTKTQDPQ